MRLRPPIEKRLRGCKVRIKFAVLLGLCIILASCAKNIVTQPTSPQEKPSAGKKEESEPEEKPQPVPEPLPPEIVVDYSGIEPGLLEIVEVEEKPGLYNSYNPQFSSDERYLAFEVNLGNLKKIYIYKVKGDFSVNRSPSFSRVREVSLEEESGDQLTDSLFESSYMESFNYEFSWFHRSSAFVFTSNAGLGDYNLFVGSVDNNDRVFYEIREKLNPESHGDYFMMTEEIQKDGQAKVSPKGDKIVFTSGRTGNGDLYLLQVDSGKLKRLTFSDDTDFFPQWSPDGTQIVYTTGGEQAHDIHIIRNVGEDKEKDEVLVRWFFDDVLPNFSPDGKWIAFYSTYNVERDPFNTKRWGLMIIPSDGSAPSAGKELIDYFQIADVVKDNTQGAAWFPNSRHIIYAKNIDSAYNPVYIYDREKGEESLVETGTNINHDITVSPHGLVSFRAQLLGWDRVFVASSSFFQEYVRQQYGQ